jgi:epoxide hydrolase
VQRCRNGRRQPGTDTQGARGASDERAGGSPGTVGPREVAADLGRGWKRGIPRDWLRVLLQDWRGFDTDALRRALDALRHQHAEVDGQTPHVVRAQGCGPNPLPLLLTLGWPGLVSRISRAAAVAMRSGRPPRSAGGRRHVDRSVAAWLSIQPGPSSNRTDCTRGRATLARLDDARARLRPLRRVRKRPRGGGHDLARPRSSGCRRRDTPLDPRPRWHRGSTHPSGERLCGRRRSVDGGRGRLCQEQATEPAMLGAALSDSPAGQAAWIAEKVVAWSSTRLDGSSAFDRGLLLYTLPLYWVTGTITTSLLPPGPTVTAPTSPSRRTSPHQSRRRRLD